MATTATSGDIFTWSGTDQTGRSTKGEIKAASQAMAKAQLRRQGIKTKSVRKKPKPLFGGQGKAIKPADIAIFTRQLATMLKAGVPLVQSFEIVADGADKPRMKELLATLYELGMEGERRKTGQRERVEASCPPELREYLAPFSGRSLPELEEVVAMIGEKKQLSPEDRVFLTLMAFKEEAGCRISSW